MEKKTKNENISLAVMRNPAKQNKTKQEKMREKKIMLSRREKIG